MIIALIYSFIAVCYMLIYGALTVHYGNELIAIADPPFDYLLQITTDWTITPFVDMSVTTDWECAEGDEVAFTRGWFGMQAACDCLGVCETDENGNEYPGCY